MTRDQPLVLVVEDYQDAREMYAAYLQFSGYSVAEAANGVEALKSMEQQRPSLIFLDLMMPGMDGFAFAVEVRQHPEWRSIPIVVVTAQDLTSEDRRRLNGHVETILQKQGDSQESLLVQVRDLLNDSTAVRLRQEHMETPTP